MSDTLITKKDLEDACEIVKHSHCVRTPLIKNVEKIGFIKCKDDVNIHLKLENMQTSGSFKTRGVFVQMERLDDEARKKGLVTMSAGNYGKAFAYSCNELKLKGKVVMPKTAPENRETLIRSYGCDVVRCDTSKLMDVVKEIEEKEGLKFLHSFDDLHLISGYTSAGMEILEDITPDIVIVCCGGGGLLAGIASAIKLNGHDNTRIYGVEPETANKMQLSFQQGKAASLPTAHSVASGLSPPFAGKLCYKICKQYVDEIVTVNDQQLAIAARTLFQKGLVVEAAGAASFAALIFNKIPNLCGNVVAVVTGGNATPLELAKLFDSIEE